MNIAQKRALFIQRAKGISLPPTGRKPLAEAILESEAKISDNDRFYVQELVGLAKLLHKGKISRNDLVRFHDKVYALEKELFGDDVEPKRYLLSYVLDTANGTYFSDSDNFRVKYVKPIICYTKNSGKSTGMRFIPIAYSSADAVLEFEDNGKKTSFLFIGYVGVKEEFRGLGLGRLALEEVAAEAVNNGLKQNSLAILEIDLPLDDIGRSSLYCGERAKFRTLGIIMPDGEKRILRMQRPGMGETEELPPTPIILGIGKVGQLLLQKISPDQEIDLTTLKGIEMTIKGFYGMYDYWYSETQGRQISQLLAETLESLKEIRKAVKRSTQVKLALLDIGHFKEINDLEKLTV